MLLILGVLLVVVSVAAAALLIAYNSGGTTETVSLFGWNIGDVNLMQAFIAGIVVGLVFLFGISMIMRAGRRNRLNRARYKEARQQARSAAAERDELAGQLQEEHHGQMTGTVDTGPRHAVPADRPVDQPTTNIRPGQSPSR